MSFTDPIADMLTRLRNANANGADKVEIPFSNLKLALAEVLKREGFINAVKVDGEGYQRTIALDLRYGPDGERVITKIERVSKPGRRIYTRKQDIPWVLSGLGVAILSTPKGVMSDARAKEENVGGEIICNVF